jgi:hypothetical protein
MNKHISLGFLRAVALEPALELAPKTITETRMTYPLELQSVPPAFLPSPQDILSHIRNRLSDASIVLHPSNQCRIQGLDVDDLLLYKTRPDVRSQLLLMQQVGLRVQEQMLNHIICSAD